MHTSTIILAPWPALLRISKHKWGLQLFSPLQFTIMAPGHKKMWATSILQMEDPPTSHSSTGVTFPLSNNWYWCYIPITNTYACIRHVLLTKDTKPLTVPFQAPTLETNMGFKYSGIRLRPCISL